MIGLLLLVFTKKEGETPKTQKSATEEEKDPKNVKNYTPVAITKILCKIFERMTNKRLIWYLEKEKKNEEPI